jgi:hypothetical protein
MRRIGLMMAVGLWALGAWQAKASISYQYVVADSSFNNVSNFTGAAGSTVTATIYLQEVLTSSSDTSVISGDNGLFGAGFFVTKSGTAGDTTITGVAANTSTEPAGFQGNTAPGHTTTTAQMLEATSNADTVGGPSPTTTGSHSSTSGTTTTNDVLLGTVTLKVGSDNSVTTYTLKSYKAVDNTDGNTITFTNGFDLDANGPNGGSTQTWTGADASTFTFTVTATPEPGGLVLSGLAACAMLLGLGCAAYVRRRAQLPKVGAVA